MTVARLTPPFAATFGRIPPDVRQGGPGQFQALLDAFNEHVSRLSGVPQIVDAPVSG
jgi:hypothetical protein